MRAYRVMIALTPIVVPLAVMTGYLCVTHFQATRSGIPQTFAIAVAAAGGSIAQWHTLPTNRWRVIATICYAVAAIIFLFFYSLAFVCVLFGECL